MNYADWLNQLKQAQSQSTPPEPKWSREQTIKAVIDSFKGSPLLKQEPPTQEDIWNAIQRRAREAFPTAMDQSEAVSRFMETPDGKKMYTAYLDAQAEHSQSNSEPPSHPSEAMQSNVPRPDLSDAQAMDDFLRTEAGSRYYSDYLNRR